MTMTSDSRGLPHLEVEGELFARGYERVGAMDEVGRGSAFGPCCVGLVVIDRRVGIFPSGLRDSKLLSERAREQLATPLREWASHWAVGESSAGEIDEHGLTAALRLAGWRALAQVGVVPDVVILDGSYDWLSPRDATLTGPSYPDVAVPEVRTMVKADLNCASVAAASVIAKVHRDDLVRQMAKRLPGYDLDRNKGYATPTHLAALRDLGPSDEHRRTWRLPGRATT
jgi:ribonuclease HII